MPRIRHPHQSGPRRYEPRRIHTTFSERDHRLHSRNENLNTLLEACEGLVREWRELDDQMGMPAELDGLDRLLDRIREALVSLGRIKEEP